MGAGALMGYVGDFEEDSFEVVVDSVVGEAQDEEAAGAEYLGALSIITVGLLVDWPI